MSLCLITHLSIKKYEVMDVQLPTFLIPALEVVSGQCQARSHWTNKKKEKPDHVLDRKCVSRLKCYGEQKILCACLPGIQL
jgi:hypothetical protein